ncbi:MAG: GNAT family N-acetyltransferase [Acidimicrobiales bacterium]
MHPSSPSSQLTIRDAVPADIEAVSALLMSAYAELGASFPWPELWDDYLEDLTDVAGRWSRSRVVVVERDGHVVATADYHPVPRRIPAQRPCLEWIEPPWRHVMTFPGGWAAVRCVGTDPARRREGNGRALVERLITLARQDRAIHVFLHSLPIMAAAMAMYEDAGFHRLPERDLPLRGGRPDRLLAFIRPLERGRVSGQVTARPPGAR